MTIDMLQDSNAPAQSMASREQAVVSFLSFGRAVARSPRQQRPGQLARPASPFLAGRALFNSNVRKRT
jgi:hypothetical protein